MSAAQKGLALHLGLIALLGGAFWLLGAYHQGNLARIMVLAVYAMGYNLLFGYTGLLSLGHALFFASGLYGLGLAIHLFGLPPAGAILSGALASLGVAGLIGFLALRTSGVAFMIVTLMFAQSGYLAVLYFGTYTRGDEGFVLQAAERMLFGLDLTAPATRYFAALFLFGAVLLALGQVVQSSFGRALVAIRENEARAAMLGYHVTRLKWIAVTLSGLVSGLSGAAYALLFGYAGASFAGVQYSILPLLWVLVGGAGTTVGPLIGTAFMFYLIDFASEWTPAYLIVVGIVLVLLTLFAPRGFAGTLRQRVFRWLP